MVVRSEKKLSRCRQCAKSFTSCHDLKMHMVKVHGSTMISGTSPPAPANLPQGWRRLEARQGAKENTFYLAPTGHRFIHITTAQEFAKVLANKKKMEVKVAEALKKKAASMAIETKMKEDSEARKRKREGVDPEREAKKRRLDSESPAPTSLTKEIKRRRKIMADRNTFKNLEKRIHKKTLVKEHGPRAVVAMLNKAKAKPTSPKVTKTKSLPNPNSKAEIEDKPLTKSLSVPPKTNNPSGEEPEKKETKTPDTKSKTTKSSVTPPKPEEVCSLQLFSSSVTPPKPEEVCRLQLFSSSVTPPKPEEVCSLQL